MKPYRKSRKLFFPIGIISLAILPVLCLQKIVEIYIIKTKPIHCIELNFPGSDTDYYTGKKFCDLRKYKTFSLTSDSLKNSIILDQSAKILNKIKTDQDTLNGIHIVFNDSTKYNDYIKAVQYSLEKFPGAFASYEKDFWSIYVSIDTVGWAEQKRERRKRMGNGCNIVY